MPGPVQPPHRDAFLVEAARRLAGDETAFGGHNLIPVWKRWPADLETPLTTWLKVGAGQGHGVLLESVMQAVQGCNIAFTDFQGCLIGAAPLKQGNDGKYVV